MRIDRLGDLGSPHQVLRAVGDATNRLDLPPPAALTGEWFGALAVIAPSLSVQPVDASRRLRRATAGSHSTTVGGGWIGYLSYPDPGSRRAARAGARGRRRLDGLRAAPRPRTAVVVRKPVRRPDARAGWSSAQHSDARAGASASTGTPPTARPIAPACWPAWRPSAAGEVYQACVCTQFTGPIAGAPLDFFVDAVARTAPARAAYVAGPWGAVASLSPELFLCRRGDTVTSSPIKGTLPLDAPPSALRASSKDVAENVMIVDLVRNDLGRVAVTGSVTVPELLAVRPAPGVWHLVSTVSAQVPLELPTSALLDATFPPASVTGTPKIRARQLISHGSTPRRGVYCGTVGLASPVAGCELNVAIRTVEFDAAGNAVLGVGGGITADSDPDAEWQECLHKAAPIIGAARLSRGRAAPRRRAHAVTARPDVAAITWAQASLTPIPSSTSAITSATSVGRSAPQHSAGQHDGDLAEHPVGRPRGQLVQRSALDLLVGLGQLAAHHRPPLRTEWSTASTQAARPAGAATRRTPHVRCSAASDASHLRRAACLRGAKPSKQNRSDGSPDTASAVVTADGPGRQLTGRPASAQAATSR